MVPLTSRDAPTPASVERAERVGASPLGGARFLLAQLLDDLDARRAGSERELADADERRAALQEQLEDADALRQHVITHVHRLDVRDVDEAFSKAASLVTELAVVEERRHRLGIRVAELGSSGDVLRACLRCLDDLSAAEGHTEADGVASFRSASRQVFQIIEEERLRIARDMHDGPAQAMANIVLAAEVLERVAHHHPERVREDLTALKGDARAALEETRRLMFDMRPLSLDDLGLVPTLRKLVREFADRAHVAATFHLVGEERRLPHTYESVLFRIVQEALTNVRKHARAGRVEVVLTMGPRKVGALVRDDGEGFDVAATEARQGRTRTLGLISMRERTALERGNLDIRSEIGRGTEVRVIFDL